MNKLQKKAKWLNYIFIGMLITASIFQISCSQTQIEKFTGNLEKAIDAFKKQKEDTEEALKEAEEARIKALEQEIIKYSSSKTKSFIEKWREADQETMNLRVRFNDVIKDADFLFAYCEKKSNIIKDRSLRDKMKGFIRDKKSGFTSEVKKTHVALIALEEAIIRGNDVIISLEIVGSLKAVGEKFKDLGDIYKTATLKLPEIEALIKEGRKLLESDLSTL